MGIDTNGFWQRLQEVFSAANAPEIARLTGRTKQTVYRWRDGQLPDLDVLTEIAESHGVSLHWLVTGKGPSRLTDAAAPTLAEPYEHGEQPNESAVEQLRTLMAADFAEVYEAMAREWRQKAADVSGTSLAHLDELIAVFPSLSDDRQAELLIIAKEFADRTREEETAKQNVRPQPQQKPKEEKKRIA